VSTRKKVLIGLSTFLPFILLVVIFGKLIMFAVQNPEGEPPLDLIIGLIGVYVLIIITFMINIIVYVGHMVRNPKLGNTEKTVWLCLMFFFNVIVMAVYYFMHIITQGKSAEEHIKE